MHIRTIADQSLTWDTSSSHSSDSTEPDNDAISINSNSSSSSHSNPPPNIPHNPYTPAPPIATITRLMTTLRSWLIPINAPNPPPIDPVHLPPPDPPHEIVILPTEQNDQPSNHQTLIDQNTANHHWGDQMQSPKPFNTFRVLSRNVNTMSTKTDYLSWKAAAHAIDQSEADTIAFQETNIAWNKIHQRKIQQILQTPTGNATISTSSSAEISTSPHQRGGTLQAILGDWTSRTVRIGQDTSGLGRWSFIELQGKDDQRYIILSGYRVCENQTIDPGSNNTFNQQYRLLHQQGHRNPDPRTKFVDDLIVTINCWRTQNKAVLICIDANENPQTPGNPGIARMFMETDLQDLHSTRYPNQLRPPTYNRGSKPIDLCAGSPEFAEALTAAWYLPFGEPLGLRGDHRTLGLDFNIDKLFRQTTSKTPSPPQRGIYSNNNKAVQKFCKLVITACREAGIHERIHTLATQTQLTPDQHDSLETIDIDLTTILVQADQKCTKPGHHPWSPELHEAYLIHHYWTLKLSTKRTGREYPQAFAKIEARVKPNKLRPQHLHTISANLRHAQQTLSAIHKAALDKRQAHLEELIQAANTCKDNHRKKLIVCLKRAEELKRCYSLVRSITKPKQKGGLSHVRIPTNQPPPAPQWESVYDPQQLEDLVLSQHRKHFSQAHGTTFTNEPLRTLINDECTSEYAQQILSGTAQIDDLPIDEYTKALLKHLKSKMTPNESHSHPMDPEQLTQGFKKWPERTTTSPSGRHLGIYKSLAKHFPPPKTDSDTTPEDNHPLQSGNDVLKLLIWMMQLAITHTHTYDRWKTIWTLLLEKETGNPQIGRLRTIHLYEADYNLILKWFSSQGFILKSEKAHRINDSQGGGRPGRSAIDLAITKVLSYEIAETLRLRVIIVDNDATACFDRMLEAPNNLACLQHGADPKYVQLHAQTQRQLRYHLKHKYGISKGFNSHSETQPWYGMGQGAGDACNRWVIGSDSMANAYQEKAHGWTIKSPLPTESVKFTLKAFIDDVNLFIGQNPEVTDIDFLKNAQQDIDRWHGILKATGGELNTKKCFWSDYHLQYDSKGFPTIRPKQTTDTQLILTNPDGTNEILQSTKSNEGIRHLGVHISMDGSQTTEEKMLYKRCRTFQQVYRQCPLTRREAAVTYTTIFLPTITYPFPATTLSLKSLNKAQSLTTPLILSTTGYNRNMPKAVVYAPTSHGGLGFRHLHSEQGLQKVLQILKHLRTRTSLGTTIDLAIKAHQMHAGVALPILEYTNPLPWMSDRWITNVREFLHSTQSTIQLDSPWTIPILRRHDIHLMNAFNEAGYSKNELQILNHCRLALQVTTLAEITDHTGGRLIPEALLNASITPNLKLVSTSNHNWPQQPSPSKTAWTLWNKALCKRFTKPGLPNQLRHPLGPWTADAALARTWHVTFNPTNNAVYRHLPSQPSERYISHQTTRSHHFYQQPQPNNRTPTLYPLTVERQKKGFRVSKPVLPIPPTPAITPPNPQSPTLLGKLRQLLPKYAPELWAQYTPHPDHPKNYLAQYLTQDNGQIFIVTDASLNAHKFGAFSWTIATTNKDLWTGDGTVPGTRRDAHSGRAEGYGLLAALTFFEKYLVATNFIQNENTRTITGYCDNLGLIQQVTSKQLQVIPQPSTAISNDYDLVNEIYHTILRIPLQIKLEHVKGHQDNDKPIEELPYPAQLNIACDERARLALATLPINLSPHPSLPTAYPHLRIRNQTIVRQLPEYLREAANLPAYYLYLTNKFNWEPQIIQTIEWRIIEFAMRKLNATDRTRIRKITHEWTPTRVSPGNYPSHERDKLCPSCHQTVETPEHLLRCDTPTRRKIRQQFHHTFSKLCIKHAIDPHLSQMWWIGMISTNPADHTADLYPEEYQPIFQSQNNIGWKQIYYGRISKQWTHYLFMNQPDLDPIQFYAKLLHQVWVYVIDLWNSRNTDQANSTDRFPANMLSDLQGIYAARDRLPTHTHDRIYNHTQEELLLKPKPYIQNWIQNNQKYIRIELKILEQQARIDTQDIRHFFLPR